MFWVRAQHDTGHTHTVAVLQREAHLLAAHGASRALPFTAPLLPLLRGAALATSEGRLLLNAPHSVTRLHDQTLIREAAPLAAWDTAVWNATAFSALLLNSTLPRAPLVLALRLRAILFRPPPHLRALLHMRLLRCTRGPPLVPRGPLLPHVSRAQPVGICAPPHHGTQGGGVIPA